MREPLTSSGVEHAAEVQWTAGRKTANWKKAVQERMFGVRDGSNRLMRQQSWLQGFIQD